jgi:hypothetical protein
MIATHLAKTLHTLRERETMCRTTPYNKTGKPNILGHFKPHLLMYSFIKAN